MPPSKVTLKSLYLIVFRGVNQQEALFCEEVSHEIYPFVTCKKIVLNPIRLAAFQIPQEHWDTAHRSFIRFKTMDEVSFPHIATLLILKLKPAESGQSIVSLAEKP